MAIVEVTIIPLGTQSASISKYVAKAVKILVNEPEIKYELTAMSTIIEGDLDRILDLARQMHKVIFNEGVKRVITAITIDDRRDKQITIESKIKSVKKKLGV